VRFANTVGSIALAGVLILAAKAYTNPPPAPAAQVAAVQNQDAGNWQAALEDVQAQAGISAPQAPDGQAVSQLLNAAQSDNVTATVGRSLLVRLSNAKAQGLGDDLPTQDSIIAAARAQLPTVTAKTYIAADLNVVVQTAASLRAYGNAVVVAVKAHPDASADQTYIEMGYAADYQDATRISDFAHRASEYRALARDLAALPVPKTLAPLHLSVVNDFSSMADTYADMTTVVEDPLRGIAGLKAFDSLASEAGRVFINIGQELNKDGILFTKDEPGAAWSALISP
jgi:hypothetical protein